MTERLVGPLPADGQPDTLVVSTIVCNGDDAVGAAGDLDEVRQCAVPGNVESQADVIGRDLADASHEAFAVGGWGRAERERTRPWFPSLAVSITEAPQAVAN